jgi:hypothetical protein
MVVSILPEINIFDPGRTARYLPKSDSKHFINRVKPLDDFVVFHIFGIIKICHMKPSGMHRVGVNDYLSDQERAGIAFR